MAPSAASDVSSGSTSGSARASRNANTAAAIQAAASPKKASTAAAGPNTSAAATASAANANDTIPVLTRPNSVSASPRIKLLTAVAWTYTPDIDPRVNVCPPVGVVIAQRLRPRTFGRGGKSLGGNLAILDVQQRADQHDLAVEMAAEKVLVALLGASTQVGKREGRYVVGATFEVKRDRVGDGASGP